MSTDPSTQGAGRRVRIGKYEIVAHIATGGMGAVYRARDTETSREVALKVLSPEMASKENMLVRFRREAASCKKLHHENIVAIYDFDEVNGTPYIAMEFVNGIDLHEYIDQEGTLDPEESRQIMMQAARALNHAHKHGIIHRDIKPSNFLITEKKGQVRVKLTDLGLAREVDNEEYRVTKSGTTVGTVDYIAPEQARDSGLADVRSDLYSLGCTWYHMLAGQTPFCQGGLAERLLKHMNDEPPDIRRFNPRVSDDLIQVLLRLLAKKPDDRYQSPQELLQDLVSLNPIAKPTAKKKGSDGRIEGAKGKASKKTPDSMRRPGSGSKKAKSNAGKKRGGVWIVAGTVGLVAVLAVIAFFAFRGDRRPHRGNLGTEADAGQTLPPVAATAGQAAGPDGKNGTTPGPENSKPVAAAVQPKYTALYKPSAVIDIAATRQEFEKPWAAALPVPPDAPVLQVGRVPSAPAGKSYASLSAAFAAAVAGQTTVIEIHDNGPLFELPAVAVDRSIVLRGKGFRPLVVWDVTRTLKAGKPGEGQSLTLLEVQRGGLTLEGLDVVAQWPDRMTGRAALLQAVDGSITANDCTFSVSGKSPDGVRVARLAGTKQDTGRCRFNRCFGRGASLVVVDSEQPGSEVLIDHSLFVGGEQALVQAKATNAKPITIRTVRSTLVCGQGLVAVQPAGAADRNPAFAWMGWDSLLACNSRQGAGAMLLIADKATTQNVRWDAINCLYTGWGTLLAADSSIGVGELSDWRVRWSRTEGEVAKPEPWPVASYPDPAETPTSLFRAADAAVAYAATGTSEESLGCKLDQLPAGREGWLGLTYERFTTSPFELLGDGGPPDMLPSTARLYQGETIDLGKVDDLGAYLRQMQRTKKFGPRIVLRLQGSGISKTSPIFTPKGSSLVLYFETSSKNEPKSEPLSLVVGSGRDTGQGDALIETEDGSLDIIGGDIRLPDQGGGQVGSYLVKVRGGDLRLQRCRLQGALGNASDGCRALIHLTGSGIATADKMRGLSLEKCILLSSRDGAQIDGIGARLIVNESLIVTGESALRFDLGKGFQGRANCQCTLSQTTVAARRSVLHIADVAEAPMVQEPLIVQSSRCAFMSPFSGAKAGVLSYDGSALARGLLVWQGDGDGFERRLHFQAASATAIPDKAQGHALWTALWGSSGDRGSMVDQGTPKSLDAKRWESQLDRLTFQVSRNRTAPGANLEKLGIKKKPL